MDSCKVTVAIPTYNRTDQLLVTLNHIFSCNPQPNEIIIHVDGNDTNTEVELENYLQRFKSLKIIRSNRQVGPGGGRNKIIHQASNSIVASFDDDSYPIDSDYFQRLQTLFDQFSEAAVIGSAIFHLDEEISADQDNAAWVADFIGCGCAYRREVFLQTRGYVALPLAYGMEEVDLALRLHAMGWKVLQSSQLRVFHNTRLEHHKNPKITAASIANLALMTYLRYPIKLWWFGLGQCLNRVVWLIRHDRTAGIFRGIFTIPKLLWKNRMERKVIPAKSLRSYFDLRYKFMPVEQISEREV